MAAQLDVPVGIASVGWGGTSVGQWLPGASGPVSDPFYDRLKNALDLLGPEGARAVLWHQGEQDADSETSAEEYADSLNAIIAQSRVDAGFDIPWGVASAAYLPFTTLASELEVRAGQQLVIDGDPLVFAGPLTDDLLGPGWRYDDIHFNEAGLRLHAASWVDVTLPRILVPEPDFAIPKILFAVAMFTLCGRGRSRSLGSISAGRTQSRFVVNDAMRVEAS